ncbi:MAG: zinc ribbon domain-containing protein [Fusobacteriaceae bacterium]|jgi:hypothetical protein|nr:zinc ribbon domain-containing protein [Fusobacteriaceae bacterium]
MNCAKCGTEIENNIEFCPKCGVSINDNLQTSENNNKKKRHGFTTFWLIVTLVSQIFSVATYLYSFRMLANFFNTSSNFFVLYIVAAIIGAVGTVLLLTWKKAGFWIFVGISIVNLILNLIIGISIGKILIGLIGVPIMWAVLQIRKNEKTTWEQLI